MRTIRHGVLSLITLFFLFTTASFGQKISADNTARYVGNGRYDWTIFLVADEDTLRQVKYVQYTLHPTFPNPIQTIKDKGTGYPFAFKSNGWGEFSIGVKVVLKNNSTVSFDYWLRLFDKARKGRR